MTTPTSCDPVRVEALRARTRALFPDLRAELERLVVLESVSNEEHDPAALDASASAVADLLRGAGFPEVEVLRGERPDGTSGAPAVVARRPAPAGAPTVLLYAHHDVQPVGEEQAWDTPPFVPTPVGDRLYGRGAADDKAGIVAHVGALRVLGDELGVGVTVFVEGEEEIGSPSFVDFLHRYRDRLAADVLVVADSANWQVGVPGLTTSLRGLVDAEVEVSVLAHPVHSGFLGGPVLDATTLLARLIATLHDERGDVAVAGLVHAPDPSVDYSEQAFRADAAVLDGVQLAGTGSVAARLWTRPAIAVIGLDAPRVATSSNTLTPSAKARLSMRIAPGQDPARAMAALVAHLKSHAPFGARVDVTPGGLGRPFLADTQAPATLAARAALSAAWGTDSVDIGVGGSIPFIADLVEVFPDATILVTGVEDPDSRAHSPNESVHLGDLENAVLAEALLLDLLAPR